MSSIVSFVSTYWVFILLVLASLVMVVAIYFLMNIGYKNPILPDPDVPKPQPAEPIAVEEPQEEVSTPTVEPSTNQRASNVEAVTPPVEEIKKKLSTPRPPKAIPTNLGKYIVSFRKTDNKWIITRENSVKVLKLFETKQEAVSYATIKALESDQTILVKRKDEPLN